MTGRVTTTEVEVGGVTLPANESVITLLGAANRDPAQYADPDRLDVGRQNIRPMSFGGGIHHCLGAQLARLEAELVFTALVERLPNLELPEKDAPAWRRQLHPARPAQASGGVALDVARTWRTVAGRGRANTRAPARIRKTAGRCARSADGSLLAVVADGMGGHAGGAVAVKVAVEAFVQAIEQGGGLADGAAGGQCRGRRGRPRASPSSPAWARPSWRLRCAATRCAGSASAIRRSISSSAGSSSG